MQAINGPVLVLSVLLVIAIVAAVAEYRVSAPSTSAGGPAAEDEFCNLCDLPDPNDEDVTPGSTHVCHTCGRAWVSAWFQIIDDMVVDVKWVPKTSLNN